MNGSADISARYTIRRDGFELDVDVTLPMHGVTGVFGESHTHTHTHTHKF